MNEASQGLVAVTELLVEGLDVPARRTELTALCAELLDVQAAALLTVNVDGALDLAAASEETAELLARFELAYDQGPGTDAFRTGTRVECADLTGGRLRWPRFAPVALDAGVTAAFGLPCTLCGAVVGALTLYGNVPGSLSARSMELSQGLVNAVSLGVTAHQWRELVVRTEQLQGALESRVSIEQAKGMLAERMNTSVDEAFTVLRRYARRTGTKMREVAQDVVRGVLTFPAED